MKAWHGFALFALGAAAGWLAAPRGDEASVEALRAERDAAASRAARSEAELATARGVPRRQRDPAMEPAGAIPEGTRAAFDAPKAPAASVAAPAASPSGPAAARAALATARQDLQKALAANDGEKALALLKKIAGLARDLPEARDDAMKLALDINRDVQAGGDLGLNVQVFYTGLGDPGIRDLMLWSLENQGASPADFRVLSVWSIPWAMPPEDAIARLDAALGVETEGSVLSAIVRNLAEMNTPKAHTAVAAVLADPARDVSIRADAALALATSRDPAVQRALEEAASASDDPRFADALRVSMVLREPPAAGCLVVSTRADGAAKAAGMRAGDLILSYNGRVVPGDGDLRREIAAVADAEAVPVVVLRDGGEVTLQVRPGTLGITPKAVRPK
jgi:hypothetical protein